MRAILRGWGPPHVVGALAIAVVAIGAVLAPAIATLGVALYLIRKGEHAAPRSRMIAYALSIVAAAIPGLPLFEPMTPATAIAIAFVSCAVLCSKLGLHARTLTPSQLFAIGAALISAFALVRELYALGPYNIIATLVLMLAFAVLGTQHERGLMRVWSSESDAGKFARRMVPPVVLLPIAFGWLSRVGVEAGLYGPELALTFFAIGSVTSLLVLVGWAASSLGDFESRYHHLYDNAPDLYTSVDEQLRIVECNTTLTRAIGRTREYLLGRSVRELYADESELILRKADGGTIDVTVHSIPIYDVENKKVGTRIAWRDITAEKRLAEVEQKQLHIQRAILESIGEGVVVADENGKFVQWNSAAEPIVRAQQTMGSPDEWPPQYGIFAADKTTRLPTENVPVRRAIRGELVDAVEVFFREPSRPDGVWLSVSARQLRSGGGAVAVFRDITAQKTAHEQLMVTDRMVSMGMLAAGVAHEINNPLAAVIANLDLSMSMIGREQRELVDQMHDAREGAERVRTIARDLKVFSRIDADQREIVDLERVLESSLRMAWNEIRHRAELKKDYRGTPRVDANESRLGQVFLNLIVNAAQAIGEGHSNMNEIRVATRTHGDGRAVVEISDTGSGMTAEVKDRLFTPFFTTKPSGFGSGLGLAICQRIVTGIGGTIEVESEVGKGSTFRVLLRPAPVQIPQRSISSEQRAVQLAPKRRGRVLVVDDEAAIGATIRRVLSGEHDVLTLTSAEEAVERIRSGARYDVIICDLMMPVMTGQEMFAEIVRLAPEQAERIVFLTGGAFTESARVFLEAIENQKLEKPFDAETIRSVVRQHVRSAG